MSWSGGDWMCPVCQHQNFKKRDTCQRCAYPKFGGPDVSSWPYNRTLAGDWYCTFMSCGYHNYASRPTCNKCGALKNMSDVSVPPDWKDGDWICTRYECGLHNYASRTVCYKCKTPRPYGGAS